MFKYNKFKIEAMLKNEEKVGRSRDRGAIKKEHTDHPYVISFPLLLGRVLYNP